MKSDSFVRALRIGGIVAAICGAGLFTAPLARRLVCDYAFRDALAAAAEAPGALEARLIAPERPAFTGSAPASRTARGFALAAALESVTSDSPASAQHAAGVAALLSGDAADAIRFFASAAERGNSPQFWTDLAAARYEAAVKNKQDEELLASLGASGRALAMQPHLAAAAYNFALAVDRLGVAPAAAEAWKAYLAHQDASAWNGAARLRLRTLLQRTPAATAWRELMTDFPRDENRLRSAASLYPQQARTWAEGQCLAGWAKAARNGDEAEANIFLARARIVGDVLHRTSGESLVYEAVAAIEKAQRDRRRLNALIEGHLQYADGRRLYRNENLSGALIRFEHASRSFGAGGSPMVSVARSYAASVLHDADRLPEALDSVDALIAIERNTSHYAMRAQLHYQRARLDATRGFWSDCLAASTQALALYDRLGERGNKGMAALLIAEAYGYMGQPAVAMRHNIDAIRLSAEDGDTFRLRVAAANLCRDFIRRRDWHTARALIRIERSIEHLSPDMAMTTDTCMRAAIVEENLGRPDAAERELHNGTSLASQARDAALRASLLADLNGAHGALARRRSPARAIGYLQQAIAYQEQTDRALLLPQLYLERARAYVAVNQADRALEDLERGIGHLERQRSHVRDTGMRYGIFDDSSELFAEAVALYVDRGDPAAAFTLLERGRARALLEQIAGTPAAPVMPPQIASVQRRMPAHTLLIEYAVLRDRLLLFGIAADFFEVREVRVDAATLTKKSSAFIEALMERRAITDVQALAADLHTILLAPIPERKRYEALVFVPDTVLQQIPFAALYDAPRHSYLIQQQLVVTTPSTAVFLEGRAHSRPASGVRTAAVFAATRGDAALALRSLPEAEREASLVAGMYERSILVTAQASIERFLTNAPNYDVVHFAGHAVVDAADPSRSALVLPSHKSGDSGFLRCSKIGATKFGKPQLIVLAACSTMRGRAGRTDGTPSIARSFLAAGVPVVAGTLWDIEDGETATLVSDFHEKIAAGMTPAGALREAQLAALRESYGPACHPGSWGAFALLGAGL